MGDRSSNADTTIVNSSVITILFPIFASYKALRSADPSQLAPWLMYWVVLSVVLLAESWTVFIIGWYDWNLFPTSIADVAVRS